MHPFTRPGELSTEEMLKDLAIVFPTLRAAPRSIHGVFSIGLPGVWVEYDGFAVMPDGELFLRQPAAEILGGEASGQAHPAFSAWLANRGWTCEYQHGTTFFLVPANEFGESIPRISRCSALDVSQPAQ